MLIKLVSKWGDSHELQVKEENTVEDVKNQYADLVNLSYDIAKIRLTHKGTILPVYKRLAVLGVHDGDTLDLSFVIGGPPVNVNWEPFVRATVPSSQATDVPLTPDIRIDFWVHRRKRVKLECLPDKNFLGDIDLGNTWDNYWDAKGIFWTDVTFPERLMVVELRDEFSSKNGSAMMEHIDQVRYNWCGVNGSYYGGDARSWQRYTTQMPIKGTIQVNTAENCASFTVEQPLKPSTWYAVLLLHSNHNCSDAIYDDMLIPFKTTANEEPAKPPSLDCCVCMERQVGVAYIPCGHVCCCTTCDVRVVTCPKCRADVKRKQKIFF